MKDLRIGNTYGGLCIEEENGKFYWSVEDYKGHLWEEIPEELYRALEKHHAHIKAEWCSENPESAHRWRN